MPLQESKHKTEAQGGHAKPFLSLREITVFSLFGAMMFASTLVLAALPNIHLLGLFIVLLTVVYRAKALFPMYLFVLLDGIYAGFALWWLPYLYVWTVLWAVTMLLPRNLPPVVQTVLYCITGGLHGILFGVIYAPGQALLFGYTWKQMLAWIAAGFPFDVIHGISNACTCTLVYPLARLLVKLNGRSGI